MKISTALGEVLRRARQARGLTLHDVQRISAGRFKPSSVGSYERGARSVSVPLLYELGSLYGVPPDRLLAQAIEIADPDSQFKVVLDLNRLPGIQGEEGRLVTDFVARIREQRGDRAGEVITLRSGDLQHLATAARTKTPDLLERLRPALYGPRS